MHAKGIEKRRLVIGKLLAFLVLLIGLVIVLGFVAYKQLSGRETINGFVSTSSYLLPTKVAVVPVTASPSATPKPTPTPLPIPINSGRSVNVPILTYHYIGNNPNPADKARDNLSVAPDKFDAELGILSKNGYHPITLDTLYAALKGGSLPSKSIVITFDDGYIDFYVNAFPIIRKYGFVVVSFIPTGLMNQGYYLSWGQIKEMDATGLVSFQAHSVNHLNLAVLLGDRLKYQLSESKKTLEGQLGKKVNFMAYPYGVSNQQSWQAVKEAGYLGAVGTWYGTVESEGNVFDMPRVKVAGGWSIDEFARRFP